MVLLSPDIGPVVSVGLFEEAEGASGCGDDTVVTVKSLVTDLVVSKELSSGSAFSSS